MREDWIECKLRDLVQYSKGKKPSNLVNEKIDNDYKPYINIKAFEKGIIDEYSNDVKANYCVDGDLLMVWDGARAGLVGKAKNGLIGSTLMKIEPKKDVHKELIFYYLKSLFATINTNTKGVGIPHVEPNLLWDSHLLFFPLPEQRAIVKKLESLFSSLDAGVADLKKAQQQLKIYRQAVLKKAFEGKLTNSEMELISLANLTTILGDGLHGTPKYSDSGEYYFINGNNLREGKIILKPETKRVDKSEFEKYKKNLGNSTVLVSINGTLGNTAFYNNENVVLGKSACYFNLNEEIDKYYIRYNLTTKHFLHYAVNNATGSTIMNVGLKTMREYSVPVPKNRSDQHKIVKQIESRLSVCDSIEQNIKESLIKAEALRQSILKKAFEGNLLTAQELAECKKAADYEPSIVLLGRIKSEQKSATIRLRKN